jgi:hypothetical protein
MKKSNKKWIPLLTVGSALCLANASRAATISWSGGVGNWNVGTNWGGGNVPGNADDATINQNNAVVTLNTSTTITRLNVQLNNGTNTSSLLIDTGGSLTVSGTGNNLWIAQQSSASPAGTVTVKGTLSYNGTVQMSTFQNTGTTPSSSLIIDGGSAFIDNTIQMTIGGASTTASATFALSNGGTISGLNSIATGAGTNTINLSTISSGIDIVDMSGAFTLGSGNNILNIDLSSYDIASGTTMNLFTYGSRSGSWSSVNIDGLGLGSIALGSNSTTPFETAFFKGDFVVAAGGLSLSGLTAIPEPELPFLAGLGALGVLLWHRRRL